MRQFLVGLVSWGGVHLVPSSSSRLFPLSNNPLGVEGGFIEELALCLLLALSTVVRIQVGNVDYLLGALSQGIAWRCSSICCGTLLLKGCLNCVRLVVFFVVGIHASLWSALFLGRRWLSGLGSSVCLTVITILLLQIYVSYWVAADVEARVKWLNMFDLGRLVRQLSDSLLILFNVVNSRCGLFLHLLRIFLARDLVDFDLLDLLFFKSCSLLLKHHHLGRLR